MKKTILTAAITLGLSSSAIAGWFGYDLDYVKSDAKGINNSHAHYVRVGGEVAGFNTMLQARTANFSGSGGMLHSVELTAGKQVGFANPFIGIGHDLGYNGNNSFQYGLVGASTGTKIGPLQTYAGFKTRLNWDDNNPKQTITFIGVAMPVTKQLSVNVGASKSTQDIKETAYGAGLRVNF